MALVTEEMIANAIKDGKTMRAAASEWNVDPANLGTYIRAKKWGVDGTWPRADRARGKRARDALVAMDNAGSIDLQGTQDSFAAQFGITQQAVSTMVKSFDKPVISAGKTKECHDHSALLMQQLRDGSVRRVCSRSRCHPVGRSIPSPSAAPSVA
jgi:hypothetical protein